MIARMLFVTAFIGVMHGAASGADEGAPTGEKPLSFLATDAELKWGPCPPIFPKGCEIAVLHGDPSQENADVFLKVPANYTIPPHWHTSAERMVLVAGELLVEYFGHKPATLRVGNYAYGPAKAPHQATCKSADPCVLFIAFEGPVDAHEPAAGTK
jgi:mannose-6-phosphate isomerase-like protein (cupin superfamily)